MTMSKSIFASRTAAVLGAAGAITVLATPAVRADLVFQATAKDYNVASNTFVPDVGPAGFYSLSDIQSMDSFQGTLLIDSAATPTKQDALEFDGNSGVEFPAPVFSGPSQSGNGDETIFAVVKPSADDSSPQTIVSGGGGSLQYRIDDTGVNAGQQAVLSRGQFQFGNSSTVVDPTKFSVIEVVLSDNNTPTAAFYDNGVMVGDAGATFGPSSLFAIARLGEAQNNGTGTDNNEAFRGDLAEVQVYDTALSTADRQAVEAKLTSTFIATAPVPEPTTLAGLGLATAGVLARRRRRTV